MDKVKTYAVTFRPLGGVTDPQIELIAKWIKKKADYYFLITEKLDHERHVHAGIVLKTPSSRSTVLIQLLRLFPELSDSEKTVFRNGIKIMYSADFMTEYMMKDDDTVVILKSLPEKNLESYFPAPKDPLPTAKAKRCSLMYHELERLWYEHHTVEAEVNTRTCRNFLWKLMYADRVWPVIEDDKKKCQIAKNLVRWLNKADTADGFVLPQFEVEEA